MKDGIYKGILTNIGGRSFLAGDDGARYLEDEIIWSGYLPHWNGFSVCARKLPQRDYETGKPIIILWPNEPAPSAPFVELYFNERLVKYPTSVLGHLAVNVNGEIFNFSHKINENEAMKPEEYFFRPALGEFAPHPASGRDNEDDPARPYYDKFGRLFMRTIHALKITGPDTPKLSRFLHGQLEIIYNTPPDPKRPAYYRDFGIFTRNCATFIRDGFRSLGYKKISGVFPRELFVNVAYFFLKQNSDPSISVSCRTLRQLSVPEAAPSVLPPLVNPVNRWKSRILSKI
jgi:hypothetical protein